MAAKKKPKQTDFALSDVGNGLTCIHPRTQELMLHLLGKYIDPEGRFNLDFLPKTIATTYTQAYPWVISLLREGFSISLFSALPEKKG